MAISYSDFLTQVRNFTEVDSNVLTDAVLENIILNSQYRIFRDVPIDAERRQQTGNLVAGQESINAPAGALIDSWPATKLPVCCLRSASMGTSLNILYCEFKIIFSKTAVVKTLESVSV